MAIEEMMLLNMSFECHKLDEILYLIKDIPYFYPQLSNKIVNHVKGVHVLEENHIYTDLKDRMIQLSSDMKLELDHHLTPERSLNIEDSQSYLLKLENELKKIKDIQDQLILEKDENEKTLEMLEKLSLSEVNLDQLTNCQYIYTRFGRFHKQNLDKLKYYEGHPFIFHELGRDHQYVWCCYIVTKNVQLEIDNIFQALGFEEIKIPSFVHGTIEDAKKELKNEIHAMEEYILRMEQKMAVLKETHKIDILKLYSTICFLNEMETYKDYVVDYQSRYAIYGFISRRDIETLKNEFKDIEGISYQELPNNILESQDIKAPVVVHNAKIVKPFEIVSHVKQSDKIDTTIAFAILYYAVFIIFLGDLGVGAVLALLGLLLRKKKQGKLLLSLAIATLLGGFVYGQVFYTVHLYQGVELFVPMIYRMIDAIMIIIAGSYTIQTVQAMCNEDLVDKFFSLKGMSGLVCLYTLLVYLTCRYEIHIHLSIKPFIIIIVICLMLMILKSIVKKKFIK